MTELLIFIGIPIIIAIPLGLLASGCNPISFIIDGMAEALNEKKNDTP